MLRVAHDRPSFEAAYRDLAPRAKAIATRILHDPSAAEDVVQEVFIELWRKPAAYDPDRGSLAAYVTVLARSRALDRRRAQATLASAQERSVREGALPHEAGEPSAAEPVLRRESAREALDALANLPAAQREAVLLAFGYGLSTREVAEVAHVPVGTAKSRLRLGLSRARSSLGAAA